MWSHLHEILETKHLENWSVFSHRQDGGRVLIAKGTEGHWLWAMEVFYVMIIVYT